MGIFDGIHNWSTNLSENEIGQLKHEIDLILKSYINEPTLFMLDKYKEKKCFIEHIIEKLGRFHIQQMNENYDDYELEFWFKNSSEFNKVHCDKDEVVFSQNHSIFHALF